ncbi:MAG: tRNA (adenosine(37)-N6)-threonylcarbamoyltransferase complex transferase subunit TsaD [Patescibacteria group bacterium]|nr:tRNA (adenosine(37)-N6)-threonylcarbamoyltransferase complex transferase subunit TsaD [Patescibacteria group bacterium]MCL5431969.1 tRNA (adenosine(37)-N6)-threonylcarbamoyltransferase complex transferase subunit TsaD [Patescibacteria group bacterium]
MSQQKVKYILGIETSCDETACAIVKDGTKIISNVVASSQDIHAKYGGIIPDQAAREQLKSILPVIHEAHVADIDAIGVTVGPGLIGSLLVGVETAKALAMAWNKPIIPVNHLVGHIYANWLEPRTQNLEPPTFPALVLIVSGGHSELVLMKDHGKFKYLGGTRDDAAGECFDKCARLLNLGYPGGPAIEKAAVAGNAKLPRPMISDDNLDFSFSGLKTAVASKLTSYPANFLAYELQEAVTDVLVSKTRRAAKKYDVKNILLAGGVAANKRLREKIPEAICPPIKLCTDNAAYIASAAFFNQKIVPWEKINADPSLGIGV